MYAYGATQRRPAPAAQGGVSVQRQRPQQIRIGRPSPQRSPRPRRAPANQSGGRLQQAFPSLYDMPGPQVGVGLGANGGLGAGGFGSLARAPQQAIPLSPQAQAQINVMNAQAGVLGSKGNMMDQMGGWLGGPAPWSQQGGGPQQPGMANLMQMLTQAYGGAGGAGNAAPAQAPAGGLGEALGGMDWTSLLATPYGPDQINAAQNQITADMGRTGHRLQQDIAGNYGARGMTQSAGPATANALSSLFSAMPGQLWDAKNAMTGANAQHGLSMAGLQQGQQAQGLQSQQLMQQRVRDYIQSLLGAGQLGLGQRQLDLSRNAQQNRQGLDWMSLLTNLMN